MCTPMRCNMRCDMNVHQHTHTLERHPAAIVQVHKRICGQIWTAAFCASPAQQAATCQATALTQTQSWDEQPAPPFPPPTHTYWHSQREAWVTMSLSSITPSSATFSFLFPKESPKNWRTPSELERTWRLCSQRRTASQRHEASHRQKEKKERKSQANLGH